MHLIRLALIATILSGLLAGCSLAPTARQRPVINVVAITYPGAAPPALIGLYRAALEITKRQTDYEINISIVSPTQEDMVPLPVDGPAAGPYTPPPTVAALEQALGQDPPPDIVLFASSFEFAAALERDLVVPLDSYVRNDRQNGIDDYFPSAIEAVSDGGQIYALPVGVSVAMLQYDKRLFDEVGVELPGPNWNWTTLVSAATRLTNANESDPVWGMNAMETSLLFSLIWQNGGEVISKDGKRTLIGEPAAVEAIEFYHALYHKHKVAQSFDGAKGGPMGGRVRGPVSVTIARPIGPGDPPPIVGPGGRIAMQPFSFGYYGGIDPWSSSGADHPVRLAEMPRGQLQATQVQVDHMIAMTSRASNPQLAYRAMTELAAEMQREGGLPARRSLANDLRQIYPSLLDEEIQAITNSLEYGRALPLVGQDRWMPKLHETLLQSLITGDKEPDEAIKEAVQAIDEALNQ